MTVEELLPAKYRDKAAEYEKGTDTMDVWFDSGTIIFWCQSIFKFSFIHGCKSSSANITLVYYNWNLFPVHDHNCVMHG
jgi:isoleucyl-tRNA synthetase